MDKLRMRFSKSGRAVYISHLDLMHTFQRAFSRAGYRLKYSEGFNPHPILSIALPLSVGTSSACELMDFRLDGEADLTEMPERLTKALPEGVEVSEVYEAERKITELKWLEAEGNFRYDELPDPEALRRFYAQQEIVISKKTKSGISDVDIVPGIKNIEIEANDTEPSSLRIHAVVSAQNPTINPDLLAEALRQLRADLAPVFVSFRRVNVYDEKMNRFQ